MQHQVDRAPPIMLVPSQLNPAHNSTTCWLTPTVILLSHLHLTHQNCLFLSQFLCYIYKRLPSLTYAVRPSPSQRIWFYLCIVLSLVEDPEGKRRIGRPSRTWEDDIKMEANGKDGRAWTGFIWLRIRRYFILTLYVPCIIIAICR